MKKNIQMNEETRKNIITAFLALYEKKNINNIRVVEIIEKAGYNRSTFY